MTALAASPPSLVAPTPRRGGSTEDRHANPAPTTRSSCGGYSVVGIDGQSCGVYPLRCKRWSCPRCGQGKARATERLITSGLGSDRLRFATLTMPADVGNEAGFERVGHCFKLLRQRIKRRFGAFECIAVAELQPNRGAAHLHVLIRGAYVPQRWLSQAAEASGFGPVTDIRRVHKGVARYMVKSLGPEQASHYPRGFHRVRWSRAWSPPSKPRPRRWLNWFIADAPPAVAARSATARGYRVLEMVGPPDHRGSPWRTVSWTPAGSPLCRSSLYPDVLARRWAA